MMLELIVYLSNRGLGRKVGRCPRILSNTLRMARKASSKYAFLANDVYNNIIIIVVGIVAQMVRLEFL
jgi:hypothetical protein